MACGKINETISRICRQQLNVDLLTDLQSICSAHDAPVDRRPQYSCKCSVIRDPCYDGVKLLADMTFHYGRGNDLSHFSFDLARRLFLDIAVLGDRDQFFIRIRLLLAVYRCLYQPLDDYIGISSVWRG